MKAFIRSVAFAALAASANTAMAQQQPVASPLYGAAWFTGPAQAYLRLGIGSGSYDISDGNWAPPGAAPNGSDPVVFFDLSEPEGVAGTIAFGRQLRIGWRGEILFTAFDNKDVSGPWSYTVPATPGPHADVSTTIESRALMANVLYDLPNIGTGRFSAQPFLSAGIGMAWNKMGDWTRTNAASSRPSRTFEGDTNTDLAWTLGAGVSWNVGKNSSGPIKLDLMYQYFDLGSAQGGSTLLSGGGSSTPVSPLEFDVSSQVISVGVRIPLNLR